MAQFKSQSNWWGMEWREDYPVVCESFITVYPERRRENV